MDARFGFFAVGDPDFFDAPWAHAADGDHVHVPTELTSGWEQQTYGMWRSFTPPQAQIPRAGWKIHVGARPEQVEAVTAAVATVCFDGLAPWKVLRTHTLVRTAQDKYVPPSLGGKTCVIYPRDAKHAASLVSHLADSLAVHPGPKAHADVTHGSAPIGLRWGAFEQDWVESDDGHWVPGVWDDGDYVPDTRGQANTRPLPPALIAALGSAPSPVLPVRQAQLIHRNNTGAVYRAVLADGHTAALKEARHHAGVDASGADAVTRLRHERDVLVRLRGHGLAPELLDYWPGPDSEFLVTQWLDGDTLAHRVSTQHPSSRADLLSSDEYLAWLHASQAELPVSLARLHALGVTHGDLTPGNVVCTTHGLRFIDFEGATLDGSAVTTSVATPGFHLKSNDHHERDRFALARTLAYLSDPDTLLLERRPDLEAEFHQAQSSRPTTTSRRQGAATVPPSPTLPELLDRLTTGMLSRSTPQRSDRLFPGSPAQFTELLGGHNLLTGAAGVLLALQAARHEPDPAALDWLASPPSGPATHVRGLGVGVEGIALALGLLGRTDQASALLEQCKAPLPRDITWARGQAGCAVAWLELGRLLGRDDVFARGLDIAHKVATAVDDQALSLPSAGLLHGWEGVAIALLSADRLSEDETGTLRGAAHHALRRALALMRPAGDRLVVHSAGRVQPGLGHGSAGFVLATALAGTEDAQLNEAARQAARGCAAVTPPIAGLNDGLAGTIIALRAIGHDRARIEELERRATWHIVPTARGWSTLGEQRLRCSDDLATGSAGLLATLAFPDLRGISQVLRLPTSW